MGSTVSYSVSIDTYNQIEHSVCLVYGQVQSGQSITITTGSLVRTYQVGQVRTEASDSEDAPSSYIVLGPVRVGHPRCYFNLHGRNTH